MESTTIIVEDKKTAKSGWISILATEGDTYTLPPKSGIVIEVGGSYEIDYFEKEQDWGTSKIIKKARAGGLPANEDPSGIKQPEKPFPLPSNSNGHSKYSDSEIKGFEAKQKAIQHACALNNSVLMTQAYASVLASNGTAKGLNEQEISSWLNSYQREMLIVFKTELGL